MAAAFENLVALDKVIHEPARLVIMTILSSCQSADFLFLQRLTGLTKGMWYTLSCKANTNTRPTSRLPGNQVGFVCSAGV
jgi:hypothetical protein